jgi:hypothetical protein
MKKKLPAFFTAVIMVLTVLMVSCGSTGAETELRYVWPSDYYVPGETIPADLASQDLNYTENPVDIPNPDRGFYRANDGRVVPVTGSEPGINTTVEVGNTPAVIAGGVTAETRVSHMYFDLRRFSGNAFIERPNPRYNDRGDGVGNTMSIEDYIKTVVPGTPRGKNQPLTPAALNYIRNSLQQVRDAKGVALVRFNYDGAGWSWVDFESEISGYVDQSIQDIEPPKETLLGHISQLKSVFYEYEDVIMAVDGGFFGPWGEMHSTTFGTSQEAYAWLLDALLDAIPPSRSIIVHAGAFLSWYNNHYGTSYNFANIDTMPDPLPGAPEARFGFFNDSYAYGEDEDDNYPNDWGSLSEGVDWLETGNGSDDYDRGRVMTWIRKQNNFYGGEAQGDATLWNTYPFVAWEAAYAQTVYLNADYEEDVHARWMDFIYTEAAVTGPMPNSYPEQDKVAIFDPVYQDRNGLEFWRDRLGYRLVLREARASETVAQDGVLWFAGKIQNVGFGNIVNKKNVYVLLKKKDAPTAYIALTNVDARNWRPDLDNRPTNTAAYRDLIFKVKLSAFGKVPAGDYDIYLKIQDPKELSFNKRCIRFANNAQNGVDPWDESLGANLIGSTTVK